MIFRHNARFHKSPFMHRFVDGARASRTRLSASASVGFEPSTDDRIDIDPVDRVSTHASSCREQGGVGFGGTNGGAR